MKRISNFIGEYGTLICGIFFVAAQVFIYIDHDAPYFISFSWDEISYFLLSSICGILGILFILGYIFLIRDVKASDIVKAIKKIANRKK
jgi:hypothetical protein